MCDTSFCGCHSRLLDYRLITSLTFHHNAVSSIICKVMIVCEVSCQRIRCRNSCCCSSLICYVRAIMNCLSCLNLSYFLTKMMSCDFILSCVTFSISFISYVFCFFSTFCVSYSFYYAKCLFKMVFLASSQFIFL